MASEFEINDCVRHKFTGKVGKIVSRHAVDYEHLYGVRYEGTNDVVLLAPFWLEPFANDEVTEC